MHQLIHQQHISPPSHSSSIFISFKLFLFLSHYPILFIAPPLISPSTSLSSIISLTYYFSSIYITPVISPPFLSQLPILNFPPDLLYLLILNSFNLHLYPPQVISLSFLSLLTTLIFSVYISSVISPHKYLLHSYSPLIILLHFYSYKLSSNYFL